MKKILNIPLLILLVLISISQIAFAQLRPNLGKAKNFAVISGLTLTDNNPQMEHGLVGAYSGISGTYSNSDSTTIGGQLDSALFYLTNSINELNSIEVQDGISITSSMDEIYAGVYYADGFTLDDYTTLQLTGDDDDIFIFNISGNVDFGDNLNMV